MRTNRAELESGKLTTTSDYSSGIQVQSVEVGSARVNTPLAIETSGTFSHGTAADLGDAPDELEAATTTAEFAGMNLSTWSGWLIWRAGRLKHVGPAGVVFGEDNPVAQLTRQDFANVFDEDAANRDRIAHLVEDDPDAAV